jgi:hypothetical protein
MGFKIRGGGGGGGGVPSGTPNFFKELNSGIEFSSILSIVQEQSLGLGITQAPATLLTGQGAGVSISTFSSGSVLTPTTEGLELGSVLNMTTPPIDETGYNIETKVYSYTGTKPIQTATNIGADNFTNPTNAQGNPNGTNATRAGQALATTNARLLGQHALIPENNQIGITLVQLKFYVEQSGTLLNNGGLQLHWRENSSSAWIQIVTYSGDVSFLTVPAVFTLSGLTSWANVNAVETAVSAVLPTLTTQVVCRCDAVIKYVEGSEL